MEEKKEDVKKMSLDEKIMELKKEVSIMKKNKDGFGYSYVDEESILLKINDKMIEFGLKLTPKFKDKTLYTEVVSYKDKKNNDVTDILVRAEMTYTWKDIFSKEEEVIDWALVGQQSDGSQALGSGLTYSNRYFLLKYFNISTSKDDPDAIRSKQAEEEEKKKMTSLQTRVKKMYADALKKFGKSELVYQKMGTDKEKFLRDYNDNEKCKILEEQLNLILKESEQK